MSDYDTTTRPGAASGQRELIVLTREDMGLELGPAGLRSATGADTRPIERILARNGARMQPLFEQSASPAASRSRSPETSGDERYYRVEAPDEKLESIAGELLDSGEVEAAYVKPAAELAVMAVEFARPDEAVVEERLNDMALTGEAPPDVTPDFTGRQGYLNPAPEGVDARYAWRFPGGRGANVRVVDLEWGWRFTHEDLRVNQGGLIAGVNSTTLRSVNHGTAVIGEIGGDANPVGVTGIAPDARVSAVAFSMPTATAIRTAADNLQRGDIMLLEIHRAGPRFNFQARDDQQGYIAVEWWPDDFAAIRYAIGRGIIVVEAAGNGRQNFDDAIYDQRPNGFPASWRNPFNPANPSSQAVVVGAGAPPPGTHGANHGPDRSRLDFSNFGRRVDAQGWGREVTTTGYGDLQGGSQDQWYTDRFSGTSSASPIVVGALACLQGALRAEGQTPLTSEGAISLLRSTGSPQTDAPGRPRTQRIGNRPNLQQMINRMVRPATTYTGVWRSGSDPHYLWVNATWPSFVAKWQELAPKNLRLIDFEITQFGTAPRYSGIWRAGSDPYYLWVNASWASFVAKWQELAAQNLRLIDIEIRRFADEWRYSGVWRAGSDPYYLWVNASWASFVAKWQDLSQRNLRLVDFEIVRMGDSLRYSGVWRQGSDAHYLWVNATWASFVAKWQELAAKNLRLTKILRTWTGSSWRYSGVWRSGSDGYYLWANASWPSFVDRWQQLSGQNMRLVDIEISRAAEAAGAVAPAMPAANSPEVEPDAMGGGDPGEGFALSSAGIGSGDGFGGGDRGAGVTLEHGLAEQPAIDDNQGNGTHGYGGGSPEAEGPVSLTGVALQFDGAETDDGEGYGGGSGAAAPSGTDEETDGVGGGSIT